MKLPKLNGFSKNKKSKFVLSKKQRIQCVVAVCLALIALLLYYVTRQFMIAALILATDLSVVLLIEFTIDRRKTKRTTTSDKRDFFLMMLIELDYSHDINIAYSKAIDALPISKLKTKLEETNNETTPQERLTPLKEEDQTDNLMLTALIEDAMEKKRRVDASFLRDYEFLFDRLYPLEKRRSIDSELLILLVFSLFLLVIISGVIQCL